MKLIDILVEELPKRGGWPKGAKCITQDGDLIVEPATCNPSDANYRGEGFWFLDSSRIGGFEVDTLASDYTTSIITREQYEAALAAKNDGWIEWSGGECPVTCGTMVDVKHRCGAVSENQQAWPKRHKESDAMVNPLSNAGQAFWRHENSSMDIIAYRLHQPQKEDQPEASEEDLNDCIGQAPVTTWSGEGLPPVGCECEYLDSNNEWYPVTIKYASNQIVVICGMTNIFGEEQETEIAKDIQLDKPQFRPIRSEADRKRDAAVGKIFDVICKSLTDESESTSFAIYEAIAAGEIPGVKLED